MKGVFGIIMLVQGSLSASAQGSFVELGQQAGINHFHRSNMHLGGGVAIFDLDNDGWEDIYLTGGEQRDKLYRNNGDGTFEEIGVAAGIGVTAAITTFGVTTGDIDNDGFRDILVLTELEEEDLLFRNNGNGTFTRLVGVFDVSTSQRALSASFGDINKDGLLDISIATYIEFTELVFDEAEEEIIGFAHTCYPDLLFINNGDLTFTESSVQYGLNGNGCGLATAFTDFDGDNNMDLFVVNDFGQWIVPNALYRNQYPATSFEDVSEAMDIDARMFGMGVAIGDYDRDGDLDYYNTNIGPNYLFRNDGSYFTEVGESAGVENDSLNGLNTTSWGCFFFDHDNDGWQDLFVANGEIPAAEFIANVFDDPDKLFRNNGDGTFTDVTDAVGLGSVQRARGAAFGDINNDGLLDIVVNNVSEYQMGATALLYMNTTSNDHHWLQVRLRGVQSNRDAFGSEVRIVINGESQMIEVDGGSSHASQNSSVIHFGIGESTLIDSVIVTFPSGTIRYEVNVLADQRITVDEDVVTDLALNEQKFGIRMIGPREFSVYGLGPNMISTEVFDITGRIVHSISMTGNSAILPDHFQGIYALRATDGNRSCSLITVLRNP